MVDFTDPRPQYPTDGRVVLVKCIKNDNVTLRWATRGYKYSNYGWKDHPGGGIWSMAHPTIVGWKHMEDATDDERKEADSRR